MSCLEPLCELNEGGEELSIVSSQSGSRGERRPHCRLPSRPPPLQCCCCPLASSPLKAHTTFPGFHELSKTAIWKNPQFIILPKLLTSISINERLQSSYRDSLSDKKKLLS